MKPRKPLKRGKPPKRTALKRGPGRKAVRESDALAAFKAAVHARRTCQASGMRFQGVPICGRPDMHAGHHAHHVWPEDRDAGRHDPERGLLLCSTAHTWAHGHPAAAAPLGLLRPL